MVCGKTSMAVGQRTCYQEIKTNSQNKTGSTTSVRPQINLGITLCHNMILRLTLLLLVINGPTERAEQACMISRMEVQLEHCEDRRAGDESRVLKQPAWCRMSFNSGFSSSPCVWWKSVCKCDTHSVAQWKRWPVQEWRNQEDAWNALVWELEHIFVLTFQE